MIYRVIISPLSLNNWYNAWRWYEKKQKGLGDKFEEALLERLRMISDDPHRYTKVRKPYREIIVIGYPYQVLYTIDDKMKTVTIYSIWHISRNPKNKYK